MNKKNIGLAILIAGIIGFFYFSGKKSDYQILTKRFSLAKIHHLQMDVKADQNYLFSFWAVDEEGGFKNQWADVKAFVSLKSQANELIVEREIIASASEESGGLKRAQNGFEYNYYSEQNQTLKVEINLVSGDYANMEVYENIPDGISLYPGLSILFGLIGLVLFLKGRAAANNT